MITPCFALHGWRSGPSLGFLLVLASRLSPRTKPLLVDLGVLHQQRALHWKDDPNPWLFSRSRLAVDVREQGLQLVDHLYHLGISPCGFLLLPSQLRNKNVAYHWIELHAITLPSVLKLNWPATPTYHLSAV